MNFMHFLFIYYSCTKIEYHFNCYRLHTINAAHLQFKILLSLINLKCGNKLRISCSKYSSLVDICQYYR